MLAIKDLNDEVYLLTGASAIQRVRRVNGEKELSLTVEKTKQNAHFFDDIEKLWRVIDFNGEEYPIMLYRDIAEGEGYVREFSCLHSFFDDMRNHVIYESFTGSLTFIAMMQFIFDDSDYEFNILDSFGSQDFENFGDDYGLELFKTALDRYKAEFSVEGKIVTLRAKIGDTTDFQYRHKFNLESVEREVDALDFSTYAEGYGRGDLKQVYTSPLAAVYGKRPIKAVRDERYTLPASLLNRLKEIVDSSVKISLTVKLTDLRASGYNKNHPNEGDTIILVDDRFELKVDARIVEIKEQLHPNGTVLDCDVTLSNFDNIFEQQRRIHNATKAIADAIEGKRPLPFEALAYAVQRATIDLQNAQTEVFFPENGGFLLVSKTNPNEIVVINSAGIGVSDDAGQTFENALTGKGIVAERVIAGMLQGMTFLSDDGTSTMWVQGGDIRLTDTANGRNLNLNPLGMTGFDGAGNILFQATKTWVTSSILGTNTTNVYTAAESNGELRVVDINGIPGDGLVGSYNYLPVRSSGLYGNFWNINPASGDNPQNLYARPLSDGELRITANSTTDLYRDLRARTGYMNAVENNAMFGESVHLYMRPRSTGEVRATAAGTIDNYVPIRASGYFGSYLDTLETHLYLRPAGDPGEARVTVRGTTDVYQPIRAKDFITDTSVRGNKTNIEEYDVDTLSTVRNGSAYLYNRATDKEGARKQLGLMIDELPEVTHSDYGDSFALYALCGFLFKAAKDTLSEFEEYKQSSTERMNALLERIEALEVR